MYVRVEGYSDSRVPKKFFPYISDEDVRSGSETKPEKLLERLFVDLD